MACFYPLRGYILHGKQTEKGKAVIVFNETDLNGDYEKIDVPCGRCIGCKLDKSRDWATRCIHESQIQEEMGLFNCFITLTFDEVNNPISLEKHLFQSFIKRLRTFNDRWRWHSVSGTWRKRPQDKPSSKIRFFHCGEYGEVCVKCDKSKKQCMCGKFVAQLGRPHHHACIFGFDFPDKELTEIRNDMEYYESKCLAKLWTYGRHIIGALTWESAAYVARYCTKKVTGENSESHYRKVVKDTGEVLQLVPEYVTMSRRPGIGARWYEKYGRDVHGKDFITHQGRNLKTPKYYDSALDKRDPEALQAVKDKRIERAKLHAEHNTLLRLRSREKVKKAQAERLERKL